MTVDASVDVGIVVCHAMLVNDWLFRCALRCWLVIQTIVTDTLLIVNSDDY